MSEVKNATTTETLEERAIRAVLEEIGEELYTKLPPEALNVLIDAKEHAIVREEAEKKEFAKSVQRAKKTAYAGYVSGVLDIEADRINSISIAIGIAHKVENGIPLEEGEEEEAAVSYEYFGIEYLKKIREMHEKVQAIYMRYMPKGFGGIVVSKNEEGADNE